MAGIADKVQIDETISGQSIDDWRSYTQQKNVTWIADQQNGNYSNQVSFDLTSAISANGWMSLQESYVLMPFSSTLALGTAVSATSAWSQEQIILKDSYLNYIDSIQFFVNGEQLVDQTTTNNFPLVILDKLTMSQDELKLFGSALNIAGDTCTSIRYAGANATLNGDGYLNNNFLNKANTTTTTGYDYSVMNNGAGQRNLNFTTPGTTGTAINGVPPGFTTSNTTYQNTLMPYFSQATTAETQGVWNYVVYLPLSRISDLFAKYPLIKGSQCRLVINFNAGVTTITGTTASPSLTQMTSYAPTAGNTNTTLFTSTLIGPFDETTGGTVTITTAINPKNTAVSSTAGASGYAQLPQCRIYVTNYIINPTYEERILSNRIQKIRYLDWYQQPILKVTSGAPFNQVLSTAITNPKFLLALPFQNGSTGLYVTFGGSQYQSAFDTAPNTTCPNAMLAFQNFNISMSGQNLWQQNQNYSFDNWAQEVCKIGLNGGLNKEISSGLVDYTSWNWSPFIVADLSRRKDSQDGSYQSITVFGTNSMPVSMDYYFYIAYEKEIEIDVLTGKTSRIF